MYVLEENQSKTRNTLGGGFKSGHESNQESGTFGKMEERFKEK